MTDTIIRIRTVSINDRGQIVIPEDMRKDLKLKAKETLVLIEKKGEITMRKESAVAKKIMKEEGFWDKVKEESLKNAWGKEDEIWEKFATEDLK